MPESTGICDSCVAIYFPEVAVVLSQDTHDIKGTTQSPKGTAK